MPKKSEALLLMQLLKKIPDANTVERLLKRETLVPLLAQYGHDEDEVRRQLAHDTLPGELLLELLKQEPDVTRLLAHLPGDKQDAQQPDPDVLPDAVSVGEAYAQKQYPFSRLPRPRLPTITVAEPKQFGLVTIGLITMMFTSVMPLIFGQPIAISIGFALIGGIATGIISIPKSNPYWQRLLIGLVWSFGTLIGTVLYGEIIGTRNSVLYLELIIPILIGGLPAFILYGFLSKEF